MSGKLPEGISQDSMLKQAHNIWSMLDEMAENNPEAYRKFIDKQMKEGQESMKPPKPHMCIQTIIYMHGKSDQILFINVFEWNRIPNPKDDESPIPVMGGPVYPFCDENGTYKIVAVAFNPVVLGKFGLDSNLSEERRMLINLAIDYLVDQHKFNISRHYTLLNKDHRCKGPTKIAIQSLTKKTKDQDDEFQQQLSELEKTFGPVTQGCKDSLLNKLSSLAVDGDGDTLDSEISKANTEPEFRLPGQKPQNRKAKLVEEILETGDVVSTLPEPQYELTQEEVKGQACLVARIQLNGVSSISQCQLDISQDDVQLMVHDHFELKITLPQAIDNEQAGARFNKKTSTLTLSMPILGHS